MPDSVETTIGSLNFTDGVPADQDTIQALYDNLDRSRAVQAYLNAIPIASMQAMRKGILEFGPASYTVMAFEDLMDSKALFLTPNTSSVYFFMWVDLKDGPLVLETPPNSLGIIDNAWFHYLGDFGNAGPDKGKGGMYIMLPPGYDGDAPDSEAVVLQAETYGHWLLWRGFLKDGSPDDAVKTAKDSFRVFPLGREDGAPEMNFVNVSGKPLNTIGAMDYGFWEDVNTTIQYEPLDALSLEI